MKTSSVIFSLLLAGLLPPSPSWAAANIDHLFVLSLEELLKIKVTGSTLTPKELKTVPAAVTVFTHKQILNLGLDSLDELMNLVPGFQSYRSSLSPIDYPFSARGRRIGSSGSEILILENGMRLADPRTSGGANMVPKYPLMQVERVEFIRGPGSAVYGSNAMMGVVNIVTRTHVNEAAVSVGSFERGKAHVLAQKHTADLSLDLFVSVDGDNGDDYRVQNTFGSGELDTQDPRQLSDLNVQINWRHMKFKLHHNQYEVEDFYEVDNVSNGFNQRNGELSVFSVQKAFEFKGGASNIAFDYTRSKLAFSFQITPAGALASNSSPPSTDPQFGRVTLNNTREARLLWHNDWNIHPHASLQFGVELRQITVPEAFIESNFDSADLISGATPIRYYGSLQDTVPVQARSSTEIVGLYGQYQSSVFESTHLTLGLRHDHFSKVGGQFSPRFALVHEVNRHHSIKLLYGQAFRAPTEDELHLQNNSVISGNPDLEPETVQSSELIWLAQWPTLGVSVGYFESRYKDAIAQVPGESAAAKYDNVHQDASKGFELEVNQQITDAWLLRGAYTHIFESPQQSLRESDRLGSFTLNYHQPNWNGNLSASYQGSKKMPALDDQGERLTLDSYWQLAGKLRFFINSNLQFFIQGKNLLDKVYLTPPAINELTTGIPNRGREVLTGLVFEF